MSNEKEILNNESNNTDINNTSDNIVNSSDNSSNSEVVQTSQNQETSIPEVNGGSGPVQINENKSTETQIQEPGKIDPTPVQNEAESKEDSEGWLETHDIELPYESMSEGDYQLKLAKSQLEEIEEIQLEIAKQLEAIQKMQGSMPKVETSTPPPQQPEKPIVATPIKTNVVKPTPILKEPASEGNDGNKLKVDLEKLKKFGF